ncbi:MAG: M28 family peptidase [Candidatus Thorarchaeota archaeon]
MLLNPDEFDQNSAFKHLEFLCKNIGNRLSGSIGESKAAEYIADRFREVGKPIIEKYPHSYYEGIEANITELETGFRVSGKPMWMTKNTPEKGLEAEGLYLGSINQINRITEKDIEEKIVFVFFSRDYFEPELFRQLKTLYFMKPKGVVILSTYHKEVLRSDPFLEENSIFSIIPTILVPASKFISKIKRVDLGKFLLVVKGERKTGQLCNTSLKIEGKKQNIIVICAHHDTVEYAQGASNNASGVSIILELARRLSAKKPNFTYVFASFGGEEQGHYGVKKFLEDSDTEDIILCLNFDTIYPLPGFVASIVVGDETLFKIVQDVDLNNPYPAMSVNSTSNGGSNMIFAEKGIPSIMHMIRGTTNYGIDRTELDVISEDLLDSLGTLGKYGIRLINRLDSMAEIEFSTGIPQNLEEEVENYFNRLNFYRN